jgi:hypothetical protein
MSHDHSPSPIYSCHGFLYLLYKNSLIWLEMTHNVGISEFWYQIPTPRVEFTLSPSFHEIIMFVKVVKISMTSFKITPQWRHQ